MIIITPKFFSTLFFYWPLFSATNKFLQATCDENDRSTFAAVFPYMSSESRVLENDTKLKDDLNNSKPSAQAVLPPLRWPNGIVYYRFYDQIPFGNTTLNVPLSICEKEFIRDVMNNIMEETCVQFIDWEAAGQPDSPYVTVTSEVSKCEANPGFYGSGDYISLASRCFESYGTVQHEVLHILGLWHEHQRPDRNQYVNVIKANIQEDSYKYNYDIQNETESFGLPYELNSVMHYKGYEGGISNGPTIVSRIHKNACLGQNIGATECDFELIRRMYNCPERENKCGESLATCYPRMNSCDYLNG